MKILSIGGTRPQFIKMAVMVKAFNDFKEATGTPIEHRILHTGQHFDPQMSNVFFSELELPTPFATLAVQPGSPGMQTASMLASIEAALKNWMPDVVLIYGDTNSTLASALATVKLHIPLVHVEAGLRSFNRQMQEEINRIVSDHVSDLLLAPTMDALNQLRAEGLGDRSLLVGDVMLDAVARFSVQDECDTSLRDIVGDGSRFILATVHRAETTDHASKVGNVLRALEQLRMPIVLPLHPRLRKVLGPEGLRMLSSHSHIRVIDPLGYQGMLFLSQRATLILTDSGGLQKEAYFLGTPCITMRNETEWKDTLQGGWNCLAGTDSSSILAATHHVLSHRKEILETPRDLEAFGGGFAGAKSVEAVCSFMEVTR